jgi:hypothetical protein
LENVRRTPMIRGGRFDERRRILKAHLETTIEAQGVGPRIAARIARQLVLKFQPNALGDASVWMVVGRLVRNDIVQLQQGLRLPDRLIAVAVPKLSVEQIEHLFRELRSVDAKLGRTLAEAALEAADPVAMGRRYARAFTTAVERLAKVDPRIARTLAAVAFRSRHPVGTALTHLRQFHMLVNEFEGDCNFARTMPKAAFAAPNPAQAAREFIRHYSGVVSELTSNGLEPTIARTLASIASLGTEPAATAYKLLENFRGVYAYVRQTLPRVARSVALAACRATHPLGMAETYSENYDRIVHVVSQTDAEHARAVATQVFRSHDPEAWAERLLRQLRTNPRRST